MYSVHVCTHVSVIPVYIFVGLSIYIYLFIYLLIIQILFPILGIFNNIIIMFTPVSD